VAKQLSKKNPWKRKKPSAAELRAALKLAVLVDPRIAELMLAKETDALEVRPNS
jgi:hypothetical protein